MDGENLTSTMKRMVKGRWKALKKRCSNLFRRLGSSKTVAGQCRCPKNGETSATARRSDDEQSDDWSDDNWDNENNRQDDNGQTDSKTLRQRMTALRLKRANMLYAESKETNERSVTKLCDAKHENFRLSIATRQLEAKLYEATAKAEKLEAELLASRAVTCEQATLTNSSIAETRRLNVALSESSRQAEAVERQAEAAERRAEVVENRAKTTGRRAEVAERRAIAVERRAVAAERRARAAERQAEAARRRAEQGAEQRPALLSAVADLQGVMSSSMADLRIDVLKTAVDKLQSVLETKADETIECDRTEYCTGDGDDEAEDDEHDL